MRRLAPWSLVLAVAVSACSGKQSMRPAGDLWAEATQAYDAEAYDLAVENYKKLLDQYPFDDRAEEAEIRIAYAYFHAERHDEALAAFEAFERMHPTSPNLAAVEYHRGLASLSRYRTTDRDESAVSVALGSFRNVIDRFPGTPWAAKAELRIRECREALARGEENIAAYYLSRNSLRAAEARLRRLLENYPDTDAAADGLARFAQAFDRRGETRAARLTRATLVQDHPSAPAAARAREELERDGEPGLDGAALPQLLAELDSLRVAESRTNAPRAVSAYPDAPSAGAPGY